MAKLTKRAVDATKATGSDVFLWDDELPGFGVRIKASGAKSFLVQYRNANARSRRLTLGRYGVLTVDEARKSAKIALADVAAGADPVENRKQERGALTIDALCAEYFDKATRGLILTRRGEAKRATTLYTDRGRIERHIKPLIGKKTVKGFTTTDASRLQRDIIGGKSAADIKTGKRGRAIVTGGAGAAARTMGLLGGIFTYAVSEGYRPDNPVKGIIRAKGSVREWRLDDSGYRALGKALAAAEANGVPWQHVLAGRAVALTGCRLDEIEGLRRNEVFPDSSSLRLGTTKTGKSIRPVGSAVFAVLKLACSKSNSKFVFPSIRNENKHHTGLTKALRRIVGDTVPGLTSHGLRHSFSSTAEDIGFSIPTIKALIGHSGASVTEGYIHKIDTALVAAANRIASHIDLAMSGNKSERVVKFRTA